MKNIIALVLTLAIATGCLAQGNLYTGHFQGNAGAGSPTGTGLTNLIAGNVVGTMTNNTTGNAATATTASTATVASSVIGVLTNSISGNAATATTATTATTASSVTGILTNSISGNAARATIASNVISGITTTNEYTTNRTGSGSTETNLTSLTTTLTGVTTISSGTIVNGNLFDLTGLVPAAEMKLSLNSIATGQPQGSIYFVRGGGSGSTNNFTIQDNSYNASLGYLGIYNYFVGRTMFECLTNGAIALDTADKGLRLATNTSVTPPAAVVGYGILWNSNSALYWITTTHTNLISAP